MLIGAHIKKEKTLIKTLNNIKKIDGNALQFFTSSPKKLEPVNPIKYFLEKDEILEKYSDIGLVIHSAYTINISRFDVNTEIGNKIYECLINDLVIASNLKAVGVIVHVGKYVDMNIPTALHNMYSCIMILIQAMKELNLQTKIILETAAGQGSELLVNIDEFINFYNEINIPEYFGLCFDTCHVYSAGFKITEAYNKIQDNTNNGICVIHLNGSKTNFGSKKDRHESLHKGFITNDILVEFVQNIKTDLMIILETPDDTIKNIEIEFIKKNIKEL